MRGGGTPPTATIWLPSLRRRETRERAGEPERDDIGQVGVEIRLVGMRRHSLAIRAPWRCRQLTLDRRVRHPGGAEECGAPGAEEDHQADRRPAFLGQQAQHECDPCPDHSEYTCEAERPAPGRYALTIVPAPLRQLAPQQVLRPTPARAQRAKILAGERPLTAFCLATQLAPYLVLVACQPLAVAKQPHAYRVVTGRLHDEQ